MSNLTLTAVPSIVDIQRKDVNVDLPPAGGFVVLHGSGTGDIPLLIYRLFLVLSTDVPIDIQFGTEQDQWLSGVLQGLTNGTTITFDLSQQEWFNTGTSAGAINNSFGIWVKPFTSSGTPHLGGASWAVQEYY